MQLTIVTVRCLVALTLTSLTLAFPEGPPTNSCTTMFPDGHPADALTTNPPFQITLSTTTYTPGSNITVTMESTDNVTFYEGVMVQARRAGCANHDEAVGTWTVPAAASPYLKTMNCTHAKGALSHYTSSHKFTQTAVWTAPTSDVGAIYFRGTFVFHEDRYWMNVFSAVVNPSFMGYCPVQMVRTRPATTTPPPTTVALGRDVRSVGVAQIVGVVALVICLCY